MTTEKAAAQQGEGARAGWSSRRPSVGQASAVVGLIGGVVALVFIFKPGWKPQAPSNASKASISDTRVFQPVTFKRYLQRQQLPIDQGLSRAYLARPGVMVSFHYEIVGLRHKKLPLRWELSECRDERPGRLREQRVHARPGERRRRRRLVGLGARTGKGPRLLRHGDDLSAAGTAVRAEALRLAELPGSRELKTVLAQSARARVSSTRRSRPTAAAIRPPIARA